MCLCVSFFYLYLHLVLTAKNLLVLEKLVLLFEFLEVLYLLNFDLFNVVRVRLPSIDVVAQLRNNALLFQLFHLSASMISEHA